MLVYARSETVHMLCTPTLKMIIAPASLESKYKLLIYVAKASCRARLPPVRAHRHHGWLGAQCVKGSSAGVTDRWAIAARFARAASRVELLQPLLASAGCPLRGRNAKAVAKLWCTGVPALGELVRACVLVYVTGCTGCTYFLMFV